MFLDTSVLSKSYSIPMVAIIEDSIALTVFRTIVVIEQWGIPRLENLLFSMLTNTP